MAPRDDSHHLLTLVRDVGTMLADMKNVREDVGDLKQQLQIELPALRAEIETLKRAEAKRSTQWATTVALATGAAGIVTFAISLFGK